MTEKTLIYAHKIAAGVDPGCVDIQQENYKALCEEIDHLALFAAWLTQDPLFVRDGEAEQRLRTSDEVALKIRGYTHAFLIRAGTEKGQYFVNHDAQGVASSARVWGLTPRDLGDVIDILHETLDSVVTRYWSRERYT